MKNMFHLVPQCGDAALVSYGKGKPVTYAHYQKFLKGCIAIIGLDKNNFSMHSFRRGAVSWAVKCGIPESMIQIIGDWKSDCYKMHINCPLEVQCSFANKFGEQL